MTVTRVNVIMGGPSAEHDVSLATGNEMLVQLDRQRYAVRAVVVSRKREFYYRDLASDQTPSKSELENPGSGQFTGPLAPAASAPIWEECDVALLAVHGSFGEDGVLQGFLDTLGVPYTGSGVCASAVGMEKITSKQILEQNGLTTPPYSVYLADGSGPSAEEIAKRHGFPCFVKCPHSGSSKLVGQARDLTALRTLLTDFATKSLRVLVESRISGEEYSCPVLQQPDGTIRALPPIFIKPVNTDYFDYEAKYTKGASEEIVPAPCSPELTSIIQEAALRAHRALGCAGVSRTDMIWDGSDLHVLEINTLPGFTAASLVPKAFAATGGTFPELLDLLIRAARKDSKA